MTEGGPEEQLMSDGELGKGWRSTRLLPGTGSMVRRTLLMGHFGRWQVDKGLGANGGRSLAAPTLYTAVLNTGTGGAQPGRQRPASCFSKTSAGRSETVGTAEL